MVVKCKTCGSRDVDLHIGKFEFLNQRITRTYCSKECQLIGDYQEYLLSTIIAFIIPPLQPIAIYYFIRTIQSRKLKKKREENPKLYMNLCYHCGEELDDLNQDEGKSVCMHCGNLVHFCDLCDEYILFKQETLQIEPCGHIFHKKELLEWTEKNSVCPKCTIDIEFVDFKPE
jgi:hypothetical protein